MKPLQKKSTVLCMKNFLPFIAVAAVLMQLFE